MNTYGTTRTRLITPFEFHKYFNRPQIAQTLLQIYSFFSQTNSQHGMPFRSASEAKDPTLAFLKKSQLNISLPFFQAEGKLNVESTGCALCCPSCMLPDCMLPRLTVYSDVCMCVCVWVHACMHVFFMTNDQSRPDSKNVWVQLQEAFSILFQAIHHRHTLVNQ